MKRGLRVMALAAMVCMIAGLAATAGTAPPLLPASGHLQPTEWKSVTAAELEDVAGDLAPLLREYGGQAAEQAEYTSRPQAYSVTAYTMRDRSGAYGAFTLLRGSGQAVPIGEAAVRTSGGVLFYEGNYLVTVSGPISLGQLQALATELRGRVKEQASLPALPEYLPAGYLAGSDAYVLGPVGLARVAPLGPGDWAGFAYGAEAEVARYRRDAGETTLILLSYPTPHIARARLADFNQLFNLNLQGRANAPVVFAKRDGSLVILVAGIDSRESAEQLMSQVRYQPEISLSDAQPETLGTTVRGLFNLMIGTVVLILVVLGLSLAFAGFRLGMQLWFPGRFLDKPSDEEALFLDLGPRR
ncbi:MAG TPA: DUF6599 family protein [Candidatus Xenobia bacterium]|nr:DUF6599 family protein [Candidatus Xenobia bacterium]